MAELKFIIPVKYTAIQNGASYSHAFIIARFRADINFSTPVPI
jgi:hypothetical protein